LSAQHSNEDNFALLTLARGYLGAHNVFISGRPPGPADDILRHADKNPNTRGVAALCGTTPARTFSELAQGLSETQFTHVLVLGSYLTVPEQAAALKPARVIIAIATHEGPFVERAEVVLPASSWAECDGTFVNAQGLAQESEKAIRPQGDSQPAWKLIAALGRELGYPLNWKKLRELRAAMGREPGSVRRKPSVATATGAVE
jgi:NADH-quinone oxidoreductase subunit G